MLDQNTDRMWFVIGAVIVGAAIIFIANGTLPDLFASVTDSFEGASEIARSVVDDIVPMTEERKALYEEYAGVNLAQNTEGVLTSGGSEAQLYYNIDRSALLKMRGEWVTASFKIKSPDGSGGYARHVMTRTESGGGVYQPSRSESYPITDEWSYHTYSFRLTDAMMGHIQANTYRSLQAGVKSNNHVTGNDGVRYPVSVKEYKLELGKTATPYEG